jgi:hypothetical protein
LFGSTLYAKVFPPLVLYLQPLHCLASELKLTRRKKNRIGKHINSLLGKERKKFFLIQKMCIALP